MMETTMKSFKKDILKIQRQKTEGMILEFDEALEVVRDELEIKLKQELDAKLESNKKQDEIEHKDKEYLRRKKRKYRELITEIMYQKNIKVRNYNNEQSKRIRMLDNKTDDTNKSQGKTMSDFVDELVGEFSGYSVLEKAFNDPDVSDIFVIDWQTIFVEKKGENEKYTDEQGNLITFRSPKHFKDFLSRFLSEAGKEINNGDSKIVDFEIYGDRGCATSSAVSPRDYSLTIRKHAEDHITKSQIVGWKVLTEEMADYLGMLILGECNIIYAGLTGSGKTTSIRALLDFYVKKSKKRMLVCEDTQELFPENEHTLELVSVKSDDPKCAVPLQNLIYTALRLKPKYIIVGEVRAEEAQAAVEGMETGHSTIFTMHGGNPWNIVNRLVTKYLMAMPSLGIDVVERIIGSAVDFICIQDNIPGVGRKITTISEINYNFESGRVEVKTICRYDFKIKDFVWENKMSKETADKMLRRGIPLEELNPWVEGGLI